MSKEVIAFNQNANLPAHLVDLFDPSSAEDLITSTPSFAIMSIKGSKWRVKMGDESQPLLNEDDEPIPSVELVIIDVGKGLSKNYYGKKYQEGDDAAPDCYSHDGVAPDPAAEKPQCTTCAACPHNVWGSRVSDNGGKGKACSDSKVLAVTFASNLRNEELGGAMLLRVPPASLKDLSTFGTAMKNKGFLPQQIVIRMGFDMNVSFPKLTFKAARPLRPEEIEVIAEMYQSDQVKAITGNAPVVAKAAAKPAAAQPVIDTDFDEETEPAPVVVKAAKPKPAAKPPAEKKASGVRVGAPKVEKQMDIEEVTEAPAAKQSVIDSDIDDILGDLENL